MDIIRLLPDDVYQAAVNAASPSASNVFATMADLIPDTDTNIYNTNNSLTGNRTVTGAGNSLTFTGIAGFTVTPTAATNAKTTWNDGTGTGATTVVTGAGLNPTGFGDIGFATYVSTPGTKGYGGINDFSNQAVAQWTVYDSAFGTDEAGFFAGNTTGGGNFTYATLYHSEYASGKFHGFQANVFGERIMSQSAGLNFVPVMAPGNGLAFLSGAGGTGYIGVTNQAGFANWIGSTLDQSLAATLVVGNTTGGTDIVISDADEINFNNVGVRAYKDAGGTLFLEGLPKGIINTVTDGRTILNGTGLTWEDTTNNVTVKIGTAATQPFIQFGNGGGLSHQLQTPIITANRSATLQDATGVIAYLSDIPASGAESLAATLLVGNTTSGTDMIISRTDSLDFPIGPGGNVSMVESGAELLMQATGPTNIHIEASALGTIILEGAGGLNKGVVRLTENGTIFTTLRLLNSASRNIFVPDANGTLALTTDWETGATYTETNVVVDRSYDADSSSVDELADVLGTLIADLRSVNIIQ